MLVCQLSHVLFLPNGWFSNCYCHEQNMNLCKDSDDDEDGCDEKGEFAVRPKLEST